MSPDPTPIKRFRPLSETRSESELGESIQQNNIEHPVPPQFEQPTHNATSRSTLSSPASVNPYPVPPPPPADSQNPNPPPPPPWQRYPAGDNDRPAQSGAQMKSMTSHLLTQQTGPNPDTAYIIELIGGLFGLFGLGFMYAGHTNSGTIRLVIGIGCNIVIGFLAAITAGIVACLALPIYVIVAITSAAALKKLLVSQYQNL